MFKSIYSLENLLQAWEEFLCGKRNKKDVQIFSVRLFDSIYSLYKDLIYKTYEHGEYVAFKINDPKPRQIHKAPVRDRLLHHAVYRILYPFFDKKFIADSYSCRNDKGSHRALYRFERFVRVVSKNNTKQCWILKCDIRKFFATIDHSILIRILRENIDGADVKWLCEKIIRSFENAPGKGLPLGNLTSQLFANIYLNELDQFVKHTLKVKYYIRYADDFVIFSGDKRYLEETLIRLDTFLGDTLSLKLHEDKVYIKSIGSGVDFLGWVHFPNHRVLRTATRRRMLKHLRECPTEKIMNSYYGLLLHGNTRKLQSELKEIYQITEYVENR